MNSWKSFLVAAVVALFALATVSPVALAQAAGQAVTQAPAVVPPSNAEAATPVEFRINVEPSFVFAAFGDLRETELSNHTATDPERRVAIIHAISEMNPSFVTVSGDLVLSGGSEGDWQAWDQETAEWAAKKIPVLPAPGNHDVHRDPLLEKYFQRFPQLRQNRYYSARAGNVLLLCLDSTLPTASGPQFDWMKEKIDHLAKTTEFVVFVLHHPPVTRSADRLLGGGHSVRPTEMALGRWLEDEQKTTDARFVVIAGHVHNYERYEQSKVTYIVSGGGGATPYEIARGPNDFYKDQGPSYHYLRVAVAPGQMRIGMEKLTMANGKPMWNERDSVILTAAHPASVEKPGHQLPKDQ
jgi:acid phosphatase type 7